MEASRLPKESLYHEAPNCSKRVYLGDRFYIHNKWSLKYYFSIRGMENFHIYLWIAKDWAWTQDWYYPSMVFGILALAWCAVLLHKNIVVRSIDEVYMWIPMFMWLCANYLWMSGEVFEGDDDYVAPRASHIMEAAIAWILLYHIILRPLGVIPKDELTAQRFETVGLTPRFGYFENWRQYEHVHTLCWLGKDLSWNRKNPYFWIICLVPTILMAADFIYSCHKTKIMMVDTVHYFAQLMWIVGNMVWAVGDIFVNVNQGDPFPFYDITPEARLHCRFYAGWVMFAAYFPLIVLYLIWIPLTFMGEITPEPLIVSGDWRSVAGVPTDSGIEQKGCVKIDLEADEDGVVRSIHLSSVEHEGSVRKPV